MDRRRRQPDDPQAPLDHVNNLGGTTVMPVPEVPGGPTIALLTDPAGNRVGLVEAMPA